MIGQISMDMTTVDVTELADVAVGDPVTLIGERGGRRLTLADLAALLDTIDYEVLCAIGRRIPRVGWRTVV